MIFAQWCIVLTPDIRREACSIRLLSVFNERFTSGIHGYFINVLQIDPSQVPKYKAVLVSDSSCYQVLFLHAEIVIILLCWRLIYSL